MRPGDSASTPLPGVVTSFSSGKASSCLEGRFLDMGDLRRRVCMCVCTSPRSHMQFLGDHERQRWNAIVLFWTLARFHPVSLWGRTYHDTFFPGLDTNSAFGRTTKHDTPSRNNREHTLARTRTHTIIPQSIVSDKTSVARGAWPVRTRPCESAATPSPGDSGFVPLCFLVEGSWLENNKQGMSEGRKDEECGRGQAETEGEKRS